MMSFSILPKEINRYIVSYLEISDETHFKHNATRLVKISLSCKVLHIACMDKLLTLKKTYLYQKYCVNNTAYEIRLKQSKTNKDLDPKGAPQLFDALFTGCALASQSASTFKIYTPDIERDIKDIVILAPATMKCTLGFMRCRDKVPPLFAGCLNLNIPLNIIEFLLQNGADSRATILVCNREVNILDDLKENVNSERFEAIQALFKKYSQDVIMES